VALRRIDPLTVADDTGATFWMPELPSGLMGDRDQSGGAMAPGMDTMSPFPDLPALPPAGPPEPVNPMDPSQTLMVPGMDQPLAVPQPVDAISGAGPIAPQTWAPPGQAPGMGAPEAPGADALPALPTLGPPPGSVAGADAQEGQAFNEYSRNANLATQAAFAEKQSLAERQASAAEAQVQEWDKTKAAHDRLYAAETERADQETAEWIKEMQISASSQPDPSRYFSTRSTFQAAAWGVGLVASAISAGADQSKNIALKMLNDAIDQDVAMQRDTIQRQMEVTRLKGDRMDKRQGRNLNRLGDNEAAAWQRWAAVEKYAMAKAAIPGAEAMKAAYMQTAMHAGEKKMEITEKRATRAHEEAQARAGRAVQYAQLKEQTTARKADDLRQDKQQLIGVAQFEEERGDKYALATVKAGGAAGVGADGIEPKDKRYIDRSTGFRIRYKDGREEDIFIPKEQHKEVSERVDAVSQELAAMGDLRKAITESDWSGRTFRSDQEFNAAVESMAGPRVKLLNKGATTEADIARSYKSFLGYDPNSAISTVKGPSKAEMVSFIDKQIDVAVRRAPQAVRNLGGIKIPEGADVVFTPRQDLNIQDPIVPTTEDELATGGVKTPAAARPKTTDDVRRGAKVEAGTGRPGALPDLPDDLDRVISAYSSLATKSSPDNVREAVKKTLADIDAWEKSPKNKNPAAADDAADARLRVKAAQEDALKKSGPAMDRVRKSVQLFAKGNPGQIAEYAKEMGHRHDLSLSTAEIDELVKMAEEHIKKMKGFTPFGGAE
jgi:hypothetical protein